MNRVYKLEKYRSGGVNRYTCPHCGKKKCFTRYIDCETGEYIANECGKCNHESSCGYHYPPREFFIDHPDYSDSCYVQTSYYGSAIHAAKKPDKAYEPKEIAQTKFFDISWAEKAAKRNSTFRKWFEQLPFDKECVQKVLAVYYVGGTVKDTIVGGINYGPATIFWQIDENQNVHDAKLIAYGIDGHRISDWGNSVRAICKKTGKGPQLDETEKVLFGLHLLNHYPDKVVCIVESEKTALICACKYPAFLWLATGGCGNLQTSKLRPLMERTIMVFPDSGEYHKWSEQMKNSGHKQYTVVKALEYYEPNTDIADVILGVAKSKEQK